MGVFQRNSENFGKYRISALGWVLRVFFYFVKHAESSEKINYRRGKISWAKKWRKRRVSREKARKKSKAAVRENSYR
jgi:hypothetical protein